MANLGEFDGNLAVNKKMMIEISLELINQNFLFTTNICLRVH